MALRRSCTKPPIKWIPTEDLYILQDKLDSACDNIITEATCTENYDIQGDLFYTTKN